MCDQGNISAVCNDKILTLATRPFGLRYVLGGKMCDLNVIRRGHAGAGIGV